LVLVILGYWFPGYNEPWLLLVVVVGGDIAVAVVVPQEEIRKKVALGFYNFIACAHAP
jgi:hypothetical protein